MAVYSSSESESDSDAGSTTIHDSRRSRPSANYMQSEKGKMQNNCASRVTKRKRKIFVHAAFLPGGDRQDAVENVRQNCWPNLGLYALLDIKQTRRDIDFIIKAPKKKLISFLDSLYRPDNRGSFNYHGAFVCTTFLLYVFKIIRDLQSSVKRLKRQGGDQQDNLTGENRT